MPTKSTAEVNPLIFHVRSATGMGGGPEKTILNSPRCYEPLGYRSVCIYLHPPGDPGIDTLRDRAERAGAPFIAIPDRGPFDWKAVHLLYKLCRDHCVTVWHGHDYKTDALGLLINRFRPMRLVSTVHGWIVNSRREKWYRIVDKWALRCYDQVVCVSEKLREECLQAGIRAAACSCIPNGVDTLDFRRDLTRSEAKSQLGMDDNSVLLGAVGRLSDEKGFDLLIEAVDEVLKKGCELRLWIAGEGPARPTLERRIASSPHKDKIRLLGHIRNPRVLFQALDIYVLSSFSEGLPNSVLEAMAFATPVIATRVGGLPALIEHGENGLLIAPGSRDELIQAVTYMVGDTSLRKRFEIAGRHTVETSFSLENRMKAMCSLYDEMLSPQGTGTPDLGATRTLA